ncbi:hypothetical protein RABR111495_19035 [Rahnella bruchi]
MKVKHIINGLFLSSLIISQYSQTVKAQAVNETVRSQLDVLTSLDKYQASELYVFYNAPLGVSESTLPSAKIYIDGEFHAALKKGEYSHFCMPAGGHTLEVAYGDVASQSKKHSLKMSADLPANKRYYLAINGDQRVTAPLSLNEAEGENLLKQSKKTRFINRASAVVNCEKPDNDARLPAAKGNDYHHGIDKRQS